MTFLVRKYSPSKWPKEELETYRIEDLRADAITSCLRTSNDTLSTWAISNIADSDDAVLALVSNFDRIDKIDILIFEEEMVTNAGFIVEKTEGKTVVEYLKETHRDITGLTYKTIGEFSKLMIVTLANKTNSKRYTVKRINDLLKSAIDEGKVDPTTLKQSLLDSLN